MTMTISRRFWCWERNPHGPGWRLLVKPFGRPGGYRALDFPWHGRSIHDPWWRTRRWVAYVPGITLDIGTNQREIFSRQPRRFVFTVRQRGNTATVPAWWS